MFLFGMSLKLQSHVEIFLMNCYNKDQICFGSYTHLKALYTVDEKCFLLPHRDAGMSEVFSHLSSWILSSNTRFVFT